MSPRSPADTPTRPFEVAIVGNDAVLAALPARPMQLAHAVLACGYDLVVPVSWGEEALAEHALRALAARPSAPAIFCACPSLRARLLSAGSELAPYLISWVAPSVATARYLRALQPDVAMRITMIGGCPGTRDTSIDTRISAHDFLRLLVNRGISLNRQPVVFDSVIPPDRRRFFSLPGGCPAPKALESRAPERRLVTITDDAFAIELAEHLLGRENVLIDLSSRLGCTCCGGVDTGEHWGPSGRDEILQYEPPRAPTPILDLDVAVALDLTSIESPTPTARVERSVGRAMSHETLRLPGVSPIADARQRAERRHVAAAPPAVTPSAAMPALTVLPSSPRVANPSIGAAALAGTHDWDTVAARAVTDDVGAPTATASETVVVRQVQPARSLTQSEREVPDAVRSAPAATVVSAMSAAGVAPRTGRERTSDVPVAIPVVAATTVPEPSTPATRPLRSVPLRFHLSRKAAHPRAQSGSGKVLPRAYVRHTPVGLRTVTAADLEGAEVSEGALDVSVEPLAGVSGHTPESAPASDPELLATIEEAPPRPSPVSVTPAEIATDAEEVSLDVGADAPGDSASSTVAAPDATSTGSARDDAPGPGAGDEPADAIVVPPIDAAPAPSASAPIPDVAPDVDSRDVETASSTARRADVPGDVLARIRQQAQRPGRVVSRDTNPPREPRSIAVFVASVVLVLALVVALAVIFRRAPTAPW